MRAALIVIDMQEGSFTPRASRHDAAGVVARINALAEQARAAGGLVIFVQHAGPEGDAHHPSAPGHKLVHELRVAPNDLIVVKRSCDAFIETGLAALLEENGVRRLVVTGCATDYCVDTTVRAALGRGFATIVPADAHTTADRPHLAAQQIIAHHNAIWADFQSPAGAAQVIPARDVRFDEIIRARE